MQSNASAAASTPLQHVVKAQALMLYLLGHMEVLMFMHQHCHKP
jgi:hypothetical protein